VSLVGLEMQISYSHITLLLLQNYNICLSYQLPVISPPSVILYNFYFPTVSQPRLSRNRTLLSLIGKCKIRQNNFVALQQGNVGSKNFSTRKSKSLECHYNFLEDGSQTNPSTRRMPVGQIKILWKCKMCHNYHTRPSGTVQAAEPIRPKILHLESVAPITLLSLFAEFL
jgi:hypothetical protein